MKYVQEARALISGESRDEPVIIRIKSLQSSMEEKLELLKQLDEEILQASPTDAIEGEILEADETNTKIATVIGECCRLVASFRDEARSYRKARIYPRSYGYRVRVSPHTISECERQNDSQTEVAEVNDTQI